MKKTTLYYIKGHMFQWVKAGIYIYIYSYGNLAAHTYFRPPPSPEPLVPHAMGMAMALVGAARRALSADPLWAQLSVIGPYFGLILAARRVRSADPLLAQPSLSGPHFGIMLARLGQNGILTELASSP